MTPDDPTPADPSVFTLIIRAVVEATWNRPLHVRLWAGGTVLVAMSAAYGYVWAA